jgi:hypothetical protein
LFGIYFATTVATSGRFHPFDTTAAAAGDVALQENEARST